MKKGLSDEFFDEDKKESAPWFSFAALPQSHLHLNGTGENDGAQPEKIQ
jgi:hypothetical protein